MWAERVLEDRAERMNAVNDASVYLATKTVARMDNGSSISALRLALLRAIHAESLPRADSTAVLLSNTHGERAVFRTGCVSVVDHAPP